MNTSINSITVIPLSLRGRGSFFIVGPPQILDLYRSTTFIKSFLNVYATYPLAECTDWFVFNILLLFGGPPNDGKATEGRDVPDFPNCDGRDDMVESLFVSKSFGGPIRSPITRLLLVDLRECPLAIFARSIFKQGHETQV